MDLKKRWASFWTAAGVRKGRIPSFESLSAHYKEPHRAYHTLRHIQHCLEEFGPARDEAKDPVAVELAIWYHDAIYDTHARDNEERSAQLAEQTSAAAGLPPDLRRRAGDLIRVSTHRKPATEADARLFADIDLAILGQPEAAFWEYERQVRKEYEWVPEGEFRSQRARILETFLDRFSIYMTPRFGDLYEKQARRNLTASVLVLKGGQV